MNQLTNQRTNQPSKPTQPTTQVIQPTNQPGFSKGTNLDDYGALEVLCEDRDLLHGTQFFTLLQQVGLKLLAEFLVRLPPKRQKKTKQKNTKKKSDQNMDDRN